MPGPLDPGPVDFEPRLSARRETADETTPRLDGLQGSRSARAVARHFRSTRKAAGIRPAKPVLLQQRKVVVVARKLLSRQGANRALSAHLGYLNREGVEQDGGAARFFDSESDNVDPHAFIARCREHPGHYRLMVNPEDGCELGDLRAYGRQYVRAVERNQQFEAASIGALCTRPSLDQSGVDVFGQRAKEFDVVGTGKIECVDEKEARVGALDGLMKVEGSVFPPVAVVGACLS